MTARIGVNALYLIPGGVGGTEIYLRELLAALAAVDSTNEYLIFTNLETAPAWCLARRISSGSRRRSRPEFAPRALFGSNPFCRWKPCVIGWT